MSARVRISLCCNYLRNTPRIDALGWPVAQPRGASLDPGQPVRLSPTVSPRGDRIAGKQRHTVSRSSCLRALRRWACKPVDRAPCGSGRNGRSLWWQVPDSWRAARGVAAAAVGATTCLWHGCGARSSTKRFTCMPPSRRRGESRRRAGDTLSSTTVDARTPRSAPEPRTRHTSSNEP